MSNVGKSHWSTKLGDRYRHERICCDDLIAERLKPLLAAEGFTGGIADVAEWMGMPGEIRSQLRQHTYLAQEEGVMWEDALARLSEVRRVVIDTTGSVIYLSDETLTLLRNSTTVVYLETPLSVQQEMLRKFLECPKPVIWGDVYAPEPGEDQMATIRRCYPRLLEARAARYAELAEVTIPYDVHRSPNFAEDSLLDAIHEHFTRSPSVLSSGT